MEDGLRLTSKTVQTIYGGSLNPCCNGRWSQTSYSGTKTCAD